MEIAIENRMSKTFFIFFAVAFFLFSVFCFAGVGPEDMLISLDFPNADRLGTYAGNVTIALGEVKDEGFAEDPSYLGMGPQATYTISIKDGRIGSVRRGVTHVLKEIGMLTESSQEASYNLDVNIFRDHFTTHQTAGRFRLRTEVFLEFVFRQGNTIKGRVHACGNSETHAQVASKKKIEETYQIGFNDALYKLLNSKTFLGIAGEGWKPAAPQEKTGEYKTTRIQKDKFYGPTDEIQIEVTKAASVTGSLKPSRIIIQDFALAETEKMDKDVSDPEFARIFLPELIREHLNAYYPGAFRSIERRAEWEEKEGIVVTGELLRFKLGSFMKRVMIGFGAGKDKLEAGITFKDGSTGNVLHSYRSLSSNWGAGWQVKQGQLRDMCDQLAWDIAFFLVKSFVPDYTPPEDLEFLFDDTLYAGVNPQKNE